jgi:outer membrane protein assembly factor BamB
MADARPTRARWRAPLIIVVLGIVAAVVVRYLDVFPYEQKRSFILLGIYLGTGLALLIWWLFFSRVDRRVRIAGAVILLALPVVLLRYRGLSGDFVPIFEWRFAKTKAAQRFDGIVSADAVRTDFPQLFGPNRDGKLTTPALDPDWAKNPPQLVWRQPIGGGWGAFSVAGNRAVTQEQEGENECVTCYEVTTGKQLWKWSTPGRYDDPVAGIGPRATPTIVGDRVFSLGALGTVSCLELGSGKVVWTRDLRADAGGVEVPQWGFASSPLVHEGKVIVSAGGAKSLIAYRAESGEIVWTGGTRPVNYSSAFVYQLAGRPQIIMFNTQAITAHDPANGAVLWERDWGKGLPHVSRPIPVGENRMLFSSGYGVGSALIEITAEGNGYKTDEVWRTPRFQSKFATPVERDGYVYGVSDGVFSCLDLKDGKVKWKGPRYGHGQGLMVGDYYLQMTEQPGDIVLLQPTPEGPNELGRVNVLEAKTWNPIALTGDLLLVRNDQEAACVRLPTRPAVGATAQNP